MRLIRLLARRSRVQRRLLAEACLLLPAAALAVRLRSFPETIAFGAVELGRRTCPSCAEIVWAVEAAARRMPFRALCFERGLTLQRMLRRRGEPARLHYGIAPGGMLKAHVWVTLHGRTILGGEEAPDYPEVAQWP